jgi:hypothetical protein
MIKTTQDSMEDGEFKPRHTIEIMPVTSGTRYSIVTWFV